MLNGGGSLKICVILVKLVSCGRECVYSRGWQRGGNTLPVLTLDWPWHMIQSVRGGASGLWLQGIRYGCATKLLLHRLWRGWSFGQRRRITSCGLALRQLLYVYDKTRDVGVFSPTWVAGPLRELIHPRPSPSHHTLGADRAGLARNEPRQGHVASYLCLNPILVASAIWIWSCISLFSSLVSATHI